MNDEFLPSDRRTCAKYLGFCVRGASFVLALSTLAFAQVVNRPPPPPIHRPAPEIDPLLLSGAAVLVVGSALIARDRLMRARRNKAK